MAKIQPAFPIDAISGSLAAYPSEVFYLHRGKQICRKKGLKPQPYNSIREWFMGLMAPANVKWQELTYANAVKWREAADQLNESCEKQKARLDGRQLFLRVQFYRAMANLAPTTTPPTDLSAPSYVTSIDWVQYHYGDNKVRIRFRYDCGHQASTALFVKISPIYVHTNRKPRRWEYTSLRNPNNEIPLISYGVPPLKDIISLYPPHQLRVGFFVYIKVCCISPGGLASSPQFFGPLEVTSWP